MSVGRGGEFGRRLPSSTSRGGMGGFSFLIGYDYRKVLYD